MYSNDAKVILRKWAGMVGEGGKDAKGIGVGLGMEIRLGNSELMENRMEVIFFMFDQRAQL